MSKAESTTQAPRKGRSLEEEIAATAAKLRKLQEQQKEQQKRDREKNLKAVTDLIKAERLDLVPADQWKAAMPKLKSLLGVEKAEKAEAAKASAG